MFIYQIYRFTTEDLSVTWEQTHTTELKSIYGIFGGAFFAIANNEILVPVK